MFLFIPDLKKALKLCACAAACAAVLTLNSCSRGDKFFEGTVQYDHILESCSPQYERGFLQMLTGTASTYHFKEGNYRWDYQGSWFRHEYFFPEDAKAYFITQQEDAVYFRDVSQQNEEVVEWQIRQNQDEILGRPCDMLYLVTRPFQNPDDLKFRYIYFSPEIKIDSQWLSSLRFNSYGFIAEKIRSIPLRTVFNTEFYTITWEAKELRQVQQDDSIFALSGKDSAMPIPEP